MLATECLKMKLLIDIWTILCRISNKCTCLHILSSRSKHRSLSRIDLPRGQVEKISYVNVLKMQFFKLIEVSESRFNSGENCF